MNSMCTRNLKKVKARQKDLQYLKVKVKQNQSFYLEYQTGVLKVSRNKDTRKILEKKEQEL